MTDWIGYFLIGLALLAGILTVVLVAGAGLMYVMDVITHTETPDTRLRRVGAICAVLTFVGICVFAGMIATAPR